MLDIGWTELLVVAIVLIVVVGPRELPHVLRTFGKTMTQFRRMASDFRSQMDDALKEADMEDVSAAMRDVRKLNPANQLRDAMNPLRQTARDLQKDLKKSTSLETKVPSKADGPELPKTSYPTPGNAPKLDPVTIFDKVSKKEEAEDVALVSVRQEKSLVSRKPGFKPVARPVKSKSSGKRRGS
ncbi:Sec-independent protein translocase protein TatB [Martelella endophytica]|uniref:Sec-independent protein translocase protein TatB n=1 Tax=Martelella endophytica TaxID=1486262 RepID=UPI0006977F79|nr:Sec-independent protein translocase protein TatB [Martelella endophytica]